MSKTKATAISALRELCKDLNEKRELLADLKASEDAKYTKCIRNGRFDYMKMAEMYHNGQW
jgi:hypothetical protein